MQQYGSDGLQSQEMQTFGSECMFLSLIRYEASVGKRDSTNNMKSIVNIMEAICAIRVDPAQYHQSPPICAVAQVLSNIRQQFLSVAPASQVR